MVVENDLSLRKDGRPRPGAGEPWWLRPAAARASRAGAGGVVG